MLGVQKGFALIAGIVVTGVADFVINQKPLEQKMLIGGVLVAMSMYLHIMFPYVNPDAKGFTKDKKKA